MRILLIEDDKQLCDSLKKALRNESYAVDTASDGERGSYLARTNDYDLVLLDSILPKKEGFDVCSEIRTSGNTTPILILTTRDEIPDKVRLLNIGADDYMTKPFSFDELSARIRAILRRPKNVVNDTLTIDDLTINLITQNVARGKEKIYLTKKEYELLVYLSRNPDQLLSRGVIMEHVWDINADPFSNTLETHILNLRRKIETNQSPKLIHTIQGRGYIFGLKP